jgi:hypothetical protein
MALAKVNKDGDKVVLKLSFHEAAALHALLARVDEETNQHVAEATLMVFGALDEVRADIVEFNGRLWPTVFNEFKRDPRGLVDPAAKEY